MDKRIALFWVLKRIRRRIPAIAVMTIAHVMHAALGVYFALCTREVIDSAVSGSMPALKTACIKQGAIIASILLCLVVYRHLRDRLNADLDRDWKKNILHGLLHGEYSAVSAYHSGELLNRLNNDVRVVDDSILNMLPNIAALATRLVMAAAVLAVLDPLFAAVIIGVGCVAVIATGFMRRSLKKLHKQVSAADGRISGFIQEILEKLLMVQAMDVSDEVELRAGKILDERYNLQRKRKNLSLFANTAVSTMSYLSSFAALAWCAFRMMKGQMTFGSLTAVTQLVSQLQSPFVNLSGVIPQYIAMLAAAERLMELEEICGSAQENTVDGAEIYNKMTEIKGENLSFAYHKDIVLDGADFTICKGDFAVITGSSGAGKSTLLKLMLGIFKAENGRICAVCGDGTYTLDRTTRSLFSYVPQGNLILSGTVRDNITITRPDATEEEIQQALFTACAEEFISALHHGLDTPLRESGGGLSEGQLQRIAIARAVLGGGPVLLLDECTSALDEETEKLVLSRIKQLKDRTCIAITHRMAAVDMCSVQLDIRDGKIKTTRNQ